MAHRKAPDSEILEHHLLYEFNMLQGAYRALESGGHCPIINNALIESFAIHARALCEFFKNGQHSRKAEEFTRGEYKAKHLKSLKTEIDKLNTQIAHLTGARTTDATHKFGSDDRRNLLAALEKEAADFAGCLVDPFVGKFTPPPPVVATVGSEPPAANTPNPSN